MKPKLIFILSILLIVATSYSCENPTGDNEVIDNGNEDDNDTTRVETGLITVASSSRLWTGVAVSSDKRIFANYPRWSQNHSTSVVEITESGTKVPYPNEEWNTWSNADNPKEKFVCVQSVYIDEDDFLWILDTGNPVFRGVVDSAAKIIKIDLTNDEITDIIYVDDNIPATSSYLNDLRIDDDHIYITDSSVGTIVIIDLNTREIIQRLNSHSSTLGFYENGFSVEGQLVSLQVHADGIALDKENDYLYYKALSSPYLFRIKTEYLKDFSLSDELVESQIEFLSEYGAADGMEIGPDGILYITSLEENAIRRYSPNDGISDRLIESSILKWPDSISITKDGELYVTTSQLHLRPGERGLFKIYKYSILD